MVRPPRWRPSCPATARDASLAPGSTCQHQAGRWTRKSGHARASVQFPKKSSQSGRVSPPGRWHVPGPVVALDVSVAVSRRWPRGTCTRPSAIPRVRVMPAHLPVLLDLVGSAFGPAAGCQADETGHPEVRHRAMQCSVNSSGSGSPRLVDGNDHLLVFGEFRLDRERADSRLPDECSRAASTSNTRCFRPRRRIAYFCRSMK